MKTMKKLFNVVFFLLSPITLGVIPWIIVTAIWELNDRYIVIGFIIHTIVWLSMWRGGDIFKETCQSRDVPDDVAIFRAAVKQCNKSISISYTT